MNTPQRENSAKYLYDISKIVFTLSVVANVLSKDFRPMAFWLGIVTATLLFLFAYFLDGGRQQ
jgi:membrane-associated protease RseP (regulator of RpoE activity)